MNSSLYRPAALSQRYNDLNRTFADAWRVTDASSLFDYAPGTSTATFTNKAWPPEAPGPCVAPSSPPVTPVRWEVAAEACRVLTVANHRNNCTFDVAATGELSFVKAYQLTEQIDAQATKTDVYSTQDRGAVTLVAAVRMKKTGQPVGTATGQAAGTVQFTLDGRPIDASIVLDANGQATWRTQLGAGEHTVKAAFTPGTQVPLLPSTSLDTSLIIKKIQ